MGVAGDDKWTQCVPGGQSWGEVHRYPIPQSAPSGIVLRLTRGLEVFAELILESPLPVTYQIR